MYALKFPELCFLLVFVFLLFCCECALCHCLRPQGQTWLSCVLETPCCMGARLGCVLAVASMGDRDPSTFYPASRWPRPEDRDNKHPALFVFFRLENKARPPGCRELVFILTAAQKSKIIVLHGDQVQDMKPPTLKWPNKCLRAVSAGTVDF